MSQVQQINISCECYHRRGLLYLARPWIWGRPCRRCRRMMNTNVIVVPTTGPAMQAPPVVVTTNNQPGYVPQQMANATPAQTADDWQVAQQGIPPKYDMVVAR